jgi:hypothetical protein
MLCSCAIFAIPDVYKHVYADSYNGMFSLGLWASGSINKKGKCQDSGIPLAQMYSLLAYLYEVRWTVKYIAIMYVHSLCWMAST